MLVVIITAMMLLYGVVKGQDCPIAGQERSSCASSCTITCSNYLTISCPAVCVDGCQCPAGSVVNEKTNTCVPMTNCPRDGHTCPTVPDGTAGTCINECMNDEDCDGHLLCCSNGCGRVCSESVEFCAAIDCVFASCPNGAPPVSDDLFRCCPYCADPPPTADPNVNCSAVECLPVACNIGQVPAGECCPVCGCLAPNGQFVRQGDTFMDKCNMCSCDSDDSPTCTEIDCGPDGGALMVTSGYLLLITTSIIAHILV